MDLVSRITEVITAIGIAIKGKQDNLVSGTNIKTINSQSLLGSGNIVISGGGGGVLTATALLDFGTSGTKYKLFTINDANITLGKKVGGIMYKPTNIKVSTFIKEAIDDDEFDSIEFSIRDSSVGGFQILAKSTGIINNYKTIQYTIQ